MPALPRRDNGLLRLSDSPSRQGGLLRFNRVRVYAAREVVWGVVAMSSATQTARPDQWRMDYSPALAAIAASKRLHVTATIWICAVSILGALGVVGSVVELVRLHTAEERAVTACVLFGVLFVTTGGLLIGFAAQAVARHIASQGPWGR